MIFKHGVLFSILFMCLQAHAQLDSLQKAYNIETDEKIKVEILNQVAWHKRRVSLNQADSMASLALKQATELDMINEVAVAKNTLAVIDIMSGRFPEAVQKLKESSEINLNQEAFKGYLDNEMNIGLVYYFQGNLDTAAAILTRVSIKADSLEVPSVRAKILSNLGAIYQSQGRYEEAIESSLRCLEAAEEMKDDALYSATTGNIGLLYDYLGNFEKAIYYQRLSIEMDSILNDQSGLAYSYGNLGEIYRQMDRWPQALACYTKSLRASEEIGDSGAYTGQLMNVALYFEHVGKIDTAQSLIRKGLEISLRNNFPYQIALAHSQLGMTDLALGKEQSAIENLKKALRMSEEQEIADLWVAVLSGISEAYESAGNSDSALVYLKRHTEMSDSMKGVESTDRIERLETQFRVLEKEKTILELNEQQAQSNLAIERQWNWIISLIALLLMGSLVAFFIVYRRRQIARIELASERAQFQKQILDTTVIAQEEERQRIAKDLHDGLVQSLVAVKMGLDKLMKSDTIEKGVQDGLKIQASRVDEAAVEARNLSHQMMPRTLTESGLVAAMDDMLQKTLGETEIAYRFEHFGVGESRFKPSIEVGVFRICQELVNNIIKHSGAKSVEVQLVKTKSHLMLHVEDDGKGFAAGDPSKKSGIGLSNIYSRASSVNGEVNYEEGSPKGTVANIRIPID